MNDDIKDMMEDLKLILNFKLIKGVKNSEESVNDLIKQISESNLNLSELVENAQNNMNDREQIVFLRDLGSTIDKSNRGTMEIVSEILKIIKALLRNQTLESNGGLDELKDAIEDSLTENTNYNNFET